MKTIAVLLLAVGVSGCATTNYVPVANTRLPPKPPKECLSTMKLFPRVPTPKAGQTLPPVDSAAWGIAARQWASMAEHNRRICRAYAKRMQTWR